MPEYSFGEKLKNNGIMKIPFFVKMKLVLKQIQENSNLEMAAKNGHS
jgi:hypothetical protein